jgi:ATP-binding cassette subfamily B protein RaxB
MLSLADVSKHFTGVALELTPTPRFVPKIERQRVTLAHLLGPRPGIMGAVLQIVLLAGVLEVFGVISPLFIQLVVDSALVAEDRNLLTVLGVGFLLLALLQGSPPRGPGGAGAGTRLNSTSCAIYSITCCAYP